MARQSVATLKGGIGPRQRVWDAIRLQASNKWTVKDLEISIHGVDTETLRDYLRCLVAAGIVVISCESRKGCICRRRYQLARDEGIDAPRLRRDGSRVTQGLAQEQMWRTLRMLKQDMNSRELAAFASTSEIPVSVVAAKDYLRNLNVAGYLICTAKGKGIGKGGVLARYRLKQDRNTGAKPPMICRVGTVYDPNEQRVVWAPERITEEDAIYG